MNEPTDRELDAQLAEAFGLELDPKKIVLRRICSEPGSIGIAPATFEACWADPDWWGRRQAARFVDEEIPHYSTSWEGMGLVIEGMRKRGRFMILEMRSTMGNQWRCRVAVGDSVYAQTLDPHGPWLWTSRRPVICEYGETLPRAVALAALKALEAQEIRKAADLESR